MRIPGSMSKNVASVPARDHELALVIRINQADEVAQYNAVFMAKARPWQNMAAVAGSLRWIARPVGIRVVCPGSRRTGSSSRPQDPVPQSLVSHNSEAQLAKHLELA